MQCEPVFKLRGNKTVRGLKIKFDERIKELILWTTNATKITDSSIISPTWKIDSTIEVANVGTFGISDGELAGLVAAFRDLQSHIVKIPEANHEPTEEEKQKLFNHKYGCTSEKTPLHIIEELIEQGLHEKIAFCDVSPVLDKYMAYLPPGVEIRATIADKSLLTDEFVEKWLPKAPSLVRELVRAPAIDVPVKNTYAGVAKNAEMADYYWRNRVDNSIILYIPFKYRRRAWIPDMRRSDVPTSWRTKKFIIDWIDNDLRTFDFNIPKSLQTEEMYLAIARKMLLRIELIPPHLRTEAVMDEYFDGRTVACDYLSHLEGISLDRLRRDIAAHCEVIGPGKTLKTDASPEQIEVILAAFPNVEIAWTKERIDYISCTDLHERIPVELRVAKKKSAMSA